MTATVFKRLFIALSSISLVAVACDTDFNTIGSDILEDDIHHNNVEQYTARTVAFDRPTGAVQTNNLPVKALGVYQNPVFGKTVAHVVTQLELASVNPTFYSPTIDSVYLYVPYFSTLRTTGTDGTNTYRLDSITGDATARMKLSIHRNGYYLRDTDPVTASAQQYFSDERGMVESAIASPRLNDGVSEDNDQFFFNGNEAKRLVTNSAGAQVVKERFAPGMFMYLNKPFFQETILNHPEKLVNNNVFKEYMRGLYFKVEQIGEQAAMAMMRFNDGYIKIIYKEDQMDVNGQPVRDAAGNIKRISRTMTLNMRTNSINFFDTTPAAAYTSAIGTSDEVNGDERLFVKGGNGSLAFIDLLSPDEIAYLKSLKVNGSLLINEANLIFTVDNTASGMGQIPNTARQAYDPLRLYLYDVKNKRPIYDYYFDTSTTPSNAKYDKYVHGGLADRDSDKKAFRYKIRLTNHISNIINNDSTNVRLGLSVTESINVISNAALRTPIGSAKVAPVSSVMGQRGTVLYGSNTAVPEQNRLKLEIYYTKPN